MSGHKLAPRILPGRTFHQLVVESLAPCLWISVGGRRIDTRPSTGNSRTVAVSAHDSIRTEAPH